MKRFFKNKDELLALTPSDSAVNERILKTIEHAGLDPQETMVVGSAALLLYGAKLDSYDPLMGERHERPGDVDFASTASYMEDLFANGTRNGALATLKPTEGGRQVMLRLQTDFLPVDLITRFRQRGSIERYDQRFRALLARSSRPIDGVSARIATPSYIRRELKFNASLDLKARQDYIAFEHSQQQ